MYGIYNIKKTTFKRMKFLITAFIAALFASSADASIGTVRQLQSHSVPTIFDKTGNYSKTNCVTYFNGFCQKCSYRYYWKKNDGIDHDCVAVSDQCKSFDEKTGACTECYAGYTLKDRDCST